MAGEPTSEELRLDYDQTTDLLRTLTASASGRDATCASAGARTKRGAITGRAPAAATGDTP